MTNKDDQRRDAVLKHMLSLADTDQDYVSGEWHQLVFVGSQAQQSLDRFQHFITSAYEGAGPSR
jgi:hypothetical protein